MGKEKSNKPKEDTSRKSAKKKATASSSKKMASKAQKSSTCKRPAGSKIASKVSSQKSSKASSKASNKVSSRASSSKAKPVASSRVTKAATKRSGGSVAKSKTSKKKPPALTKANKSCKSKKSKEEPMPSTDTSEEKKKSSSGKKSSKSKPTKQEVEEGEEAAAAEEGQDGSNTDQSEYNGKDVEYQDGEEEGQLEEEKPKEEKLEFTKPTINQMKKDKKEKPLSMAETITGREFEQLFDEISELNSGVQMLKHSYGSIIKSLVAMQDTRRAKKKAAKEAAQRPADGKVTFLTTLSTCDPNELRTKSCLEAADKYDIERFLNPLTREETFQQLFDEVDDLNKHFEKIRIFYDARGRFQRDKYEEQDEIKLDRIQFNEYKLWIKKLASTVDDIARNYNDDLLNMFRLN